MASKPNATSGFWPKVIFWLLIIIIGFSYIRSLAKHPGSETDSTGSAKPPIVSDESVSAVSPEAHEQRQMPSQERAPSEPDTDPSISEDTGSVTDSSQEETAGTPSAALTQPAAVDSVVETADMRGAAGETEAPSDAGSQAETVANVEAGESAAASVSAQAPAVTTDDTAAAMRDTGVALPVDESRKSEPPASADSASVAAQDSVGSDQADATTAGSLGEGPGAAARAAMPMQPLSRGRPSPYSRERSESVTSILKEFDDLRKAAEAEMKAMRELRQAERELQQTLMAPPRTWRAPRYRSYPPAYRPYDPYDLPE